MLSEYHIHPGMAQLRYKSLVTPDGRLLPTFKPDECKIFAEQTIFPKLPPKRVAILTINWKRYDYLKRTIESMRKTAGYDFDHFVVFNEIREGENIEVDKKLFKSVIENRENLGCPKAYNQGLEMIKGDAEKISDKYDIIILTDNDVEFKTDGWLKEIVDLNERTFKLIVSPYVEGLRDNVGGSPRTGIPELGLRKNEHIAYHYLGFVKHMGNIVQAFPAKFFDRFRFNEETFKHGTQSFQIAKAAPENGFLLAYLENIYVEHMDTTVGQEKTKPEYFKELAKAKQEKYRKSFMN